MVVKDCDGYGQKLFIQCLGTALFNKRKKAVTNFLSYLISFPVHTEPAGRQNKNIFSIILTLSPVMYSFKTSFYFWSFPLYTGSHSPKAVDGKPSNSNHRYLSRSKPL